MKTVEYYLAPRSPWTYLGHKRLAEIAARHDAIIDLRPFDLSVIFPESGGLQLKDRPKQRQVYRLVELKRWSAYLDIPLNPQPRFFPLDEIPAGRLIAATILEHGNDAGMTIAFALLRAVWAEERDPTDPQTLIMIADACGWNGKALLGASQQPEAQELLDRNTRAAMEHQVYGAPWYVYKGESFWGQDRLEFLDRALAAH